MSDGDQSRGWTYVADVVDATIAAAAWRGSWRGEGGGVAARVPGVAPAVAVRVPEVVRLPRVRGHDDEHPAGAVEESRPEHERRVADAAVRRADPDFVRAATGQVIGGVAPVGHPRPIRTLVDVWLSEHEVIWAAGGHQHTVFPTSYDELLKLTGGEPADVSGQPPPSGSDS